MTSLDSSSSSNDCIIIDDQDQQLQHNICTQQCVGINPYMPLASNSRQRRSSNTSIVRCWERARKTSKKSFVTNKNGFSFLVMSYNILAQTLLEGHSYLYIENPKSALFWEYRFKLILAEIKTVKPDVICLQEVQQSHLQEISSRLDELGYEGIYKQRTGIRDDGCAIFYKTNVFTLIEHQSVEFLQPDTTVLDRDNIGLMAKLVSKLLPDTPLVVCTTHLLYNPRRNDVRLAQIQVFLAEIDRFSYISKSKSGEACHLPIILTGDLNSKPDDPVTKLIIEGQISSEYYTSGLENIAVTDNCQHLGVYLERKDEEEVQVQPVSKLYHSEKSDLHENSQSNDDRTQGHGHLFNRDYVNHHFNMKSVYNCFKDNGETEATTRQHNWITVDYIFYSSNDVTSNLQLQERLRLPTEYECQEIGPIPNHQFGSDHLSLAARFVLYSISESMD